MTVSLERKGPIRFNIKLNIVRDIWNVFLNLASEYVVHTFSHQPVCLLNRRQDRSDVASLSGNQQ